ncbi:hypothetical protein AD006_30255 (plasmid) [Pseudonocardia sp. EC080610-09]|nr:hypothetical protein AD006_30255 [Pseudonocardia sp. EC080610-09]ALL85532.1 hypothetical protein AD017_30995 [Pseudonocardia sp. EC080619-01]
MGFIGCGAERCRTDESGPPHREGSRRESGLGVLRAPAAGHPALVHDHVGDIAELAIEPVGDLDQVVERAVLSE